MHNIKNGMSVWDPRYIATLTAQSAAERLAIEKCRVFTHYKSPTLTRPDWTAIAWGFVALTAITLALVWA